VDIDGHFNFSGIVTIKRTVNGWHAQVNPNPFEKNFKINIQSPLKDKATLIITDISGRQLLKQNIQMAPGNNSFEINGSAKFTNGSYLLSIFATQQTQSIKIIKGGEQ
jgi:hypothetical protein